MDQIKIGKYIAEKRKVLGLTQRQLAEQLGMSDKSVSKWERGVCLPDVSVYAPLCSALGISVNEFLAGEDIAREALPQKAEDNLLQISADSRGRQRKLKRVIALLAAVAILAAALAGAMLWQVRRPRNYFAPLDPESAEMELARMISGPAYPRVYRVQTSDSYRALTVWCTAYRDGVLVGKEKYGLAMSGAGGISGEGMIVLAPDTQHAVIKLVLAGSGYRSVYEIPAFEAPDEETAFGTGSAMASETPIRFGEEQGLAAFIWTSGMKIYQWPLSAYADGGGLGPPEGEAYDYVYYFSVEFEK